MKVRPSHLRDSFQLLASLIQLPAGEKNVWRIYAKIYRFRFGTPRVSPVEFLVKFLKIV